MNGYNSNKTDFVLRLKGVKYKLHKMVFQSGSKFFDDLIRQNQDTQRRRQHRDYQKLDDVTKLELPEWMHPKAFNMFIRYLYLGEIENYSNFETMYEFYKIAYNFRHYILETQIVVQHLMPELTLNDSI